MPSVVVEDTACCNKPISEVFDYISNFENTQQWDPGVQAATKITPGPAKLGSEWDVVTVFKGNSKTMRFKVVDFQPPWSLVLEGDSEISKTIDTIRLEVRGPNTTIVYYKAEISLKGWRSPVIAFVQQDLIQLGRDAMTGLESALNGTTSQEKLPSSENLSFSAEIPSRWGAWNINRRESIVCVGDVEFVFSIVSDLRTMANWHPYVKSVRLVETGAIGTQYDVCTLVRDEERYLRYRVVECTPPCRFVMEGDALESCQLDTIQFVAGPQPGTTSIEWSSELCLKGWRMPFATFVRKDLDETGKLALRSLQDYCANIGDKVWCEVPLPKN